MIAATDETRSSRETKVAAEARSKAGPRRCYERMEIDVDASVSAMCSMLAHSCSHDRDRAVKSRPGKGGVEGRPINKAYPVMLKRLW